MKKLIALLAGIIFGIGLSLSGMTNTEKILGFLDIFGQWDASLMVVLMASLALTIPAFHFILRRKKPVFDQVFHLPNNIHIDKKLIIGGILFGIGWGLYGYCPGPAIASLTYMQTDTFLFVISMIFGMAAANKLTENKC